MATLLKGGPAAAAITEALVPRAARLRDAGIPPTLAIVRLGQRPDDMAYERSAAKRCEAVGIAVEKFALDEGCTQSELLAVIRHVNEDDTIHGCLLLRPLPAGLDERTVCETLSPAKDVDGITSTSLATVFTGSGRGFAPCTAEACLRLLTHSGCGLTGKRVTVVGRSLVIGRPVSMLAQRRNATVTMCHTGTADLAAECRRADIVIAAAGRPAILGDGCFSPGQTVVDVGIHACADGTLCGDVDFSAAERTVSAITPVPGGVGAVTTAILAEHVVMAAEEVCP